MSTTIDERVVSMQFDNKQFESNVQTSLSTLDKLKQSLNLTGASKGLENVSSAAKNCNLSPLSSAVETVRLKFSALEIMAVTALTNITNSAVNAGKRLVSAFTIDPIKSGLEEYETQINAVQTILANTQSKGTTLDQVNQALDELNHYADKTIYNFTEMTRNIGTFTAAGVDLDTSVAAIKGIANLAAVSGSTSQQASTAMYQLSQALASGTVKLMDWNSVVNAGMGGQVFQDALKETARVHGIAIDDMIAKEGSFRETLQTGWLSSEILTETLQKFTGDLTEEQLKSMGYTEKQVTEIMKLGETANDAATKVKTFTQLMDTLKEAAQSGWTQTWELLVGDFEQAKSLWTSVSDVFSEMINNSADSRNTLLEGALKSNWDKFVDKLGEAGVETSDYQNALAKTIKEHGGSLDGLITKYGSLEEVIRSGVVSADILKEALGKLGKTGSSLDLVKGVVKKNQRGDDVKQIEQALKSLGYNLTGKDGIDYSDDGYYGDLTEKAVKEFQKAQGLKVTGIVDEQTLAALKEATSATTELEDSIYGLIDGITELGGRDLIIESFKNAWQGLVNIAKPIKEAFREVFPPTTSEQLYNAIKGVNELTAKFKEFTERNASKIKDTFKGIFSVVSIGTTFLKKLAGGIVSLIGNFSGLGDGVLGVTSSIGNWLTSLSDSIKGSDIFGKAIDKIVGFLSKVITKAKECMSFLKEKFVVPGWDGFLSVLTAIWDVITKIGSKIAEVGKAIGGTLANAFKNGNLSEGLNLLNSGLIAGILFKFKDVIKEGWGGFFGGIAENLEGITGILDTVRDSLEAWQQNLKAGTLLKIAVAIGILAGAIFVLAGIDPSKLAASLGAVSVLFAELMGSLAVFSKLNYKSLSGMGKVATSIIALSVAILILSSACKNLSGLSWEELGKGLLGVLGLMAIVVAAAKALTSESKGAIKGATQMVIFAAAIKILASACRDLSSLSWEELAKGLVGVGILMAEIAVFLRTAKFSGKAITTAIGIVILSAAIKILASCCKDFAQMKWKEIGKGLAAIGGLLAELAIFTNLAGNAKHIISTGLALILIGAAMKIFASAVSDFSQMSWEEIGKGLAAMAGALLSVAVATKIMPKNMISIGIGLAIVGGALLILSSALEKMSGMSWDELIRSLTALGGSMLILALGLQQMNGTITGSLALIIAAGALAILTPVLMGLGSMSWESIAKGLITIAGAFAVIGIAGMVLSPLIPVILGLAGAFVLIGIAVLGIGVGLAAAAAGLAALAGVTAAGATAIVAALTIIVSGVASLIPTIVRELGNGIIEFCNVIAEGAPAIGEAVKAIVLTLVDVFVECVPALADGLGQLIVGVLDALVKYTPQIIESLIIFIIEVLDGVSSRMPELVEAVLNVFTSLFSAVAEALMNLDGQTALYTALGAGIMAVLIGAVGALAPLIPSAMAGVVGLGALVAELAVVIAAIGALGQIPGLEWLIGEGATVIMSIGNALGGFVGGIIGGIGEGITNSLPDIGTNLSTFMTNLGPFIEGAKNIDATLMTGVQTIADIISTLTSASILDSLTSWITGGSSLTSFVADLIPFGIGIKAFANIVSGIDESAVTAATNAASTLVAIADNIPNTGGLVSFLTGDNDMATFGTQLVAFGTAIKSFSTSVTGIDTEAMTAVATASTQLVTLANNIPNTGGLVSFLTGENDMGTFGTQLVTFGTAIKAFSTSVAGVDAAAITTVATASASLVTLANNIPNTGGLVSFFTGDNDMATFGTQLASFGAAIKNFSTQVTGIDTAAITAASTAGQTLSAMANTLPETGGIFSWFSGDNDMETFGKQLVKFGTSIKDFSTKVTGIDTAAITSASDTGNALSTMATTLSSNENIKNLGTYGGYIETFGGKLKNFYNKIKDIDDTKFSTIATSLTNLASISSDGSGLNTFAESLGKIGTSGIEKFLSSFTDSSSKVTAAGSTMVENLIKGVKSKISSVTGAAKELTSKTVSTLKSAYSDFYSAGGYLVQGFADGISANTYMATAKASAMAEAAKQAARNALGIKSPSKEFYKIGKFTGQGFVNALSDYESRTYKAGASMAEATKSGLSNAISKVRDLIDSGIDTQPTIRPVLDLSDISDGANMINGMFGLSPSIDMLANVGAISSMMNRNQNGTNDDVVSAIKDLGRKIGNISGDTYNVNGVTYDDGSNITDAVRTLVRAAKVERRI